MSGRFDAEDEGVILGDWLDASLDAVLFGEAVPSLESFFFDDLPESFPRDSCEVWVASVSRRRAKVEPSGHCRWGRLETYNPLAEALHFRRKLLLCGDGVSNGQLKGNGGA